jgi:DNA-directed RNA polymerase specialized sigma24 family protein
VQRSVPALYLGERDSVLGRRNREFELFFRSTKDHLFRSLIVMVGNRDQAEDAVAEAYTRALDHWNTVCRHPAPTAWVATTALNYVLSGQRAIDVATYVTSGEVVNSTSDHP